MKHSRPWILQSITRWKAKLKFAESRSKYWTKRKNKVYMDKWKRKIEIAQKTLTSRRKELDQYRKQSKLVNAVNKLDSYGIEFLILNEGIRLEPYNDDGKPSSTSNGHATIGVGHLIHYGPVTEADKAKYKGFNKQDAIDLFRQDVATFEDAVNEVWKGAKLAKTQNRFNACVSFAFNIGVDGFKRSEVAKHIKAGNSIAAAEAFDNWHSPRMIIPRRNREKALFLKKNVTT